jgi:hypothetical protein
MESVDNKAGLGRIRVKVSVGSFNLEAETLGIAKSRESPKVSQFGARSRLAQGYFQLPRQDLFLFF